MTTVAYRILQWLDGYWHVYVCTAIEKLYDKEYDYELDQR